MTVLGTWCFVLGPVLGPWSVHGARSLVLRPDWRERCLLDRQFPYPHSCRCEDGVGQRRCQRWHRRFAQATQMRVRSDERGLDVRSVRDVNHLLVAEVAFDDLTLGDGDLAEQGSRQRVHDAALDLRCCAVHVDHVAAVDCSIDVENLQSTFR